MIVTDKRMDASEIKNAAAGKWQEILPNVAGIDRELLDGRNHPCPKCGGKDRFRLIDNDAGALLCNQCFREKNGDGFAAIQWLTGCTFPEAVGMVAKYLHLEHGSNNGNGKAKPQTNGRGHELVNKIAAMVNCTGDALRVYGAWGYGNRVFIPMFGPDGKQCSVITMNEKDTKGKFAKGKPTGLFLPGPGRLPKPGETWVIVEGPKDAATLYGLGFLTAGLPGNHMNEKFASLFDGVHVVIVPDLDKPGFEGAKKTATVLMEE